MKKFVYKGENRSLYNKRYCYDSGMFLDENKNKLSPLEDGEVSSAFFKDMVEIIPDITPLIVDYAYSYGTRAIEVYENMYRRFGWRLCFKNNFAPQKKLYAMNATPEGYSVHFLRHNNWTKSDNGVWLNKIYTNKIEESWPVKEFYDPQYTHIKGEFRVVFAHNTKGYAFVGVYETIGWKETYDTQLHEQRIVKTYKLISKEYPIQN